MITDNIQLGDKVDFCPAQQMAQAQEAGGSPRMYKSQVTDVGENGEVEIAMPIEKGQVRLLPLGVRYGFVFYTNSGMYHCMGQIKERCKRDNIYVLRVELYSRMEKYQRRQYYRYSCLMDAEYYRITEAEAKECAPEDILSHLRDDCFYEKKRTCMVLDVSGGGARIKAEENLQADSFLLFILKLSNDQMDEQHYIAGHVVTSEELKGEPGWYEARIQFIIKEDRVREEIIKYIFEEERKDISVE